MELWGKLYGVVG